MARFALALLAAAFLVLAGCRSASDTPEATAASINGLMMLIEFEGIDGLRHWERELDARGLTALVQAQDNVLRQWPGDFRRLAAKGYVISGLYAETPFWDVPYADQHRLMKQVKEAVESLTGRPMRVFGSRYFAYDENTLKAADALGIEYVLARGTAGERAILYAPREHRARIISVSNVPFKEMGTGSLCDYSLWARGSTDGDFASVVERVIARAPSDMILVSHAYLGGSKMRWWRTYEAALARREIAWHGFDDWLRASRQIALANADIPVNREVKYVAPKPAVPLEQLEDVPGVRQAALPAEPLGACQ